MTDKEIIEKTREVIYKNMIKGSINKQQTSYHYTKPSPGRYPFQFFWDTCFHVYILTALGEYKMAKEHLTSLFSMQKDSGFVGHMIYWDRLKPGRITDVFQSKPRLRNFFQSHMSALVQPPLAAQATERIYQGSKDRKFLKEMLPKLKKYYGWLGRNRDFDGSHLLTIISPFESGMDWKPTYDVALGLTERKANWKLFLQVVRVDLRNYLSNYNLKTIWKKGYFVVKDVGFNTIYIQNLRAMASLCREMNDPEGPEFDELATQATQSMLQIMYNEEDAAFYDVHGKDNRQIKVLTPTIFYPVVLHHVPDQVVKKVMDHHFFNDNEFDVRYPLPSVAKNHPSYNPGESIYIWRGPTWIVNNWFMHQFLIEKGYRREASKMVNSIKQLITKSGFREYYNPATGEGYGAKNFTWAGLVVDMMQMEKEKESGKWIL